MSGQKWVKLWVELLDNEKILSINSSGFCSETDRKVDEKLTKSCQVPDKKRDTVLFIWVQILCLAGKINAGGVLQVTEGMPYTPKLLADRLRRKVADVSLALEVFSNLGMIEVVDGFYAVKNWSRYQGSEVEDRKREYDRQYQAQKRASERQNAERQPYDNRTTTNTTIVRQSSPKKKKKNISTPSYDVVDKRAGARENDDADDENEEFIPPTVEEVKAACDELGLHVDPARFVSYYSQRKWVAGYRQIGDNVKKPVILRDWRSKLIEWDRNDIDDKAARLKAKNTQAMYKSYETSEAFDAALRRSYGDQYDELFGDRGGGGDG